MGPSLPRWTPRRTVIDLYNERDSTPWYWRGVATFSVISIMVGSLIFPSSFKPSSSLTTTPLSSTIAALILLVLGYGSSLVTALICRSWIFQVDIIFVPCLTSCVLGLINVLYTLFTHGSSAQWTSASIAALTLSVISTLAYTIAALLRFRKVHIVRARDAMHRCRADSPADVKMPETELQRQQLLRLLLQQADDKQPSPADSHRTFKIDWPGVEERRNTTATLRKLPRAAGNTNESRYSAFYNGREHIVRPPPQMNSVPEETLLDSRTDSPGGVGRLELCALVAPNNTYQDSEIPGMVNIYLNPLPRFTPPHVPRLQTNGYPVEKPEIHDLNSQLFTEKNQYGMVDNIEDGRGQYGLAVGEKLPRSVSQSSEQSRESRRREIELGSRGTGEG